MKIRSDFITNSSSSSFIIAYRSLPKIDEETLAKYPFLKGYGKMVENILFTEGDNDTTAGDKFTSKEEWDKHFIDKYGWGDQNTVSAILEEEDYYVENYQNVINHLEKGFYILEKRIDTNDNFCSNMLYEIEDGENFIVLEGE